MNPIHRYFTIISLALTLVSGALYGQAGETIVEGSFAGMTIPQFANEIENRYGIKLFYRSSDIEDLVIRNDYEKVTLNALLYSELAGTTINYFISEDGFVILTRGVRIKYGHTGVLADSNYISREEYVALMEEDGDDQYSVFTIGSPPGPRGDVTISGYVRSRSSGEPVIGAVFTIDELKRGAMTNQYGYYSMTLPKGNYNVEFSCLGMKSLKRQLSIYGSGTMDIDMKENLIPIGSITVTAEGDAGLSRMEVGLEKLSIRTVKLLPSNLGEADIIKTALLLPGVQSVGEGSAGFNVRGGSADQNLVLLYDVPLFNTSHFLGFFSAVNPEVINDITLYKGGIPAKYGGRISSVMHIVPRDGNKKEISGSGGISPVTSNLMVEGPIIRDRTSFLLAGRSTYSNWLLKLLDETSLAGSRISFYDINLRLVHEVNDKNNIEFSGYRSHDDFKFNFDTLYSYKNEIYSLKWRHIFSNRLFGVFSANSSSYRYNVSSSRDMFNSFELKHDLDYSQLSAIFTWYPGYRHQVDMGIDLTGYSIIPGELIPVGDSSVVSRTIIERQRALNPSVFIGDEIKLTDRLTLDAGLRLSAFLSAGPSTVYSYLPGFALSPATITDTTYYESLQVSQRYISPELRLSLNYLIGNSSSIKLNYNSTSQFIHQLTNTAAVSPTDIWVLSGPHLKPQRGTQVAAGVYTRLFNKMLEVSVEGYYKRIDDMIDFKGGAKLLLNGQIETDIINTEGRARGLEFMVRKDNGRFNGWISYTWSSSMLRSKGVYAEEIINGGDWFPANYDKPHDLSVVLNYIFSRRFSISSTYSYSTGRPITYPIATFTYGGIDILHYSDRNSYRIPDYSRLDLAFTINGNLKSKKLAHSTFTFSVYNLLGRDNVYSIYFDTQNKLVQGYRLSVFARAIPSVSYNFKF